jgi:hypothetical protein
MRVSVISHLTKNRKPGITVREALIFARSGSKLPNKVFCKLHSYGLLNDDGTLTSISNRLLDGFIAEEDIEDMRK